MTHVLRLLTGMGFFLIACVTGLLVDEILYYSRRKARIQRDRLSVRSNRS